MILIIKHYPNINSKHSFYCGDAAGRPENWIVGSKRDFSSIDINFARNIGLQYKSPEEILLQMRVPNIILPKRKFLQCKNKKFPVTNESIQNKTLILMVGPPASGKSNIAKLFKKFTIISNKEYNTRIKIFKQLKKIINEYKSKIIIDATNPTKELRKLYIQYAKQYDYKIIVIQIKINKLYNQYLNYYRAETLKTTIIPRVAFAIYYKKFQKPTLNEGIDKIINYEVCFKLKKKYWFL